MLQRLESRKPAEAGKYVEAAEAAETAEAKASDAKAYFTNTF